MQENLKSDNKKENNEKKKNVKQREREELQILLCISYHHSRRIVVNNI